jgi:3-isopropylmalate/(R)-2-methylmalate dehydratase small subunit
MKKFTIFSGTPAPMAMINVDTDMIIPKNFLKTIKRSGLGKALFFEQRYDNEGNERPDFILNRAPYREAKIIVAGENFGCGSSREHAPWALDDFGIRCVIAPSFADIFYNNCFKNGMLPITLAPALVDVLMEDARKGEPLTIDLPNQLIKRANGESIPFDLDPFRKTCLLEGLDEIGLTLQKGPFIANFEARQRLSQPWLWR